MQTAQRKRRAWPWVLLGMFIVVLIAGSYSAYEYYQNQVRIATTCDPNQIYTDPSQSDQPQRAVDPQSGQIARTDIGCEVYVTPVRTFSGFDIKVTPLEDDQSVEVISTAAKIGSLVRFERKMHNLADVYYAVVAYLTGQGTLAKAPFLVRCSNSSCAEANTV